LAHEREWLDIAVSLRNLSRAEAQGATTMKALSYLALLVGLVFVPAVGTAEPPKAEKKRQFYGPWSSYEHRGYHYRLLYFQPTPGAEYQYHYCILLQGQPRYIYYFDPVAGKYWGRLDLEGRGEAVFAQLRKEDQKALVRDIPETAFPTLGKLPPLPGTKDDVALEPPPNDVPK
jgi:hypothetical protein